MSDGRADFKMSEGVKIPGSEELDMIKMVHRISESASIFAFTYIIRPADFWGQTRNRREAKRNNIRLNHTDSMKRIQGDINTTFSLTSKTMLAFGHKPDPKEFL